MNWDVFQQRTRTPKEVAFASAWEMETKSLGLYLLMEHNI